MYLGVMLWMQEVRKRALQKYGPWCGAHLHHKKHINSTEKKLTVLTSPHTQHSHKHNRKRVQVRKRLENFFSKGLASLHSIVLSSASRQLLTTVYVLELGPADAHAFPIKSSVKNE